MKLKKMNKKYYMLCCFSIINILNIKSAHTLIPTIPNVTLQTSIFNINRQLGKQSIETNARKMFFPPYSKIPKILQIGNKENQYLEKDIVEDRDKDSLIKRHLIQSCKESWQKETIITFGLLGLTCMSLKKTCTLVKRRELFLTNMAEKQVNQFSQKMINESFIGKAMSNLKNINPQAMYKKSLEKCSYFKENDKKYLNNPLNIKNIAIDSNKNTALKKSDNLLINNDIYEENIFDKNKLQAVEIYKNYFNPDLDYYSRKKSDNKNNEKEQQDNHNKDRQKFNSKITGGIIVNIFLFENLRRSMSASEKLQLEDKDLDQNKFPDLNEKEEEDLELIIENSIKNNQTIHIPESIKFIKKFLEKNEKIENLELVFKTVCTASSLAILKSLGTFKEINFKKRGYFQAHALRAFPKKDVEKIFKQCNGHLPRQIIISYSFAILLYGGYHYYLSKNGHHKNVISKAIDKQAQLFAETLTHPIESFNTLKSICDKKLLNEK